MSLSADDIVLFLRKLRLRLVDLWPIRWVAFILRRLRGPAPRFLTRLAVDLCVLILGMVTFRYIVWSQKFTIDYDK